LNRRLAILSALLLTACFDAGQFVWAEDYVAKVSGTSPQGYVIGPGDVISVRVYSQEAMSAHGKVRPDGKLSIPFLNDVEVAGYTPAALGAQLQTRLKEFIHLPVVTVSLDEPKQAYFSLLGEVKGTGQFPIDPNGTTVLQAIALGGGLNDFAHKDRIFVTRPGNPQVRIRFDYAKLAKGEDKAAQFKLQTGDVIVVN
jgi:polysaccharide export outer membrane protein